MSRRVIMKKVVVCIVAVAALIGTPALAADMATKAPPPQPAPVIVPDWTGLYFSGELGWVRDSYVWNTNDPFTPNFNSTFSLSSTDGVWGVHGGYQQQFSWLVLGVEGGVSATFKRKFASFTSPGTGAGIPCGLAFPGQICQARVNYVETLGGKLGVAWQDWLIYGVGGAALGIDVSSQIMLVGAALLPGLADITNPQNARGYYVGGGIDYILRKTRFVDVIVGAEYQHVALESVQEFSSANGFAPGADQRAIQATEDIAWAKLTLKWNPFAP